MPELEIRAASEDDVPLILTLIKELAEYERLSHKVVATEAMLRNSLFGERRVAEALLGYLGDDPAGFALFFTASRPFWVSPVSTWRTCTCDRSFAAWASAGLCWFTSRGWRRSGAAGGWSGRCWTGTSRPSASTRVSAPPR